MTDQDDLIEDAMEQIGNWQCEQDKEPAEELYERMVRRVQG